MNDRTNQLADWLDALGYRDYTLSPASEDASFRTYHRIQCGGKSWIVMDAPPDKEPCDQFIAIANKLCDANLSAPKIIEVNLPLGFLILTDFGQASYLSLLDNNSEESLYADALSALLQMQIKIDCVGLPVYDEALLMEEMELFKHWFLGELFGIELNPAQIVQWDSIKQALVQNALAQPQVFVHRDYHSRNLMKIEQGNPGILDFQDALKGPVTYDLVSLLRDCYIDWPANRVDQLALDYYEFAIANNLVEVKPVIFMHWFNLMGIQRHLKAIGIFSRLKIRDGKGDYLKDIPRTLEYVQQVSACETSMIGLEALVSDLGLKIRVKNLL